MTESANNLVTKIAELHKAGHLVAGYVGSHVLANGVDTLVEAARVLRDRDVRDIEFVIVGDGMQKESTLRLANRYGLPNVTFWESVPKRNVPAVLNTLDVTLFSPRDLAVHRYGISPNKLFDYLACGRPIVFSCAIEDTAVSASGGGICVPAESPEAIADALVELASMGVAGRNAMGEKGRRWVYQEHSATALAGRFLEALVQARR